MDNRLSLIACIKCHTIDNQITGLELSKRFDISTEKIRSIVHEERMGEHKDLGSSTTGYFRITDINGWRITRNHLLSRVIKTVDIIRNGDRHFQYIADEDQLKMFENLT
jgi:hypothetical protein